MKKFFQISLFAIICLISFTSAKVAGNTYFKWDPVSPLPVPYNCLVEQPNVIPNPSGFSIRILIDIRTSLPVRKETLPVGKTIQQHMLDEGIENFDCVETTFAFE
jgi:hypothetical protein